MRTNIWRPHPLYLSALLLVACVYMAVGLVVTVYAAVGGPHPAVLFAVAAAGPTYMLAALLWHMATGRDPYGE